MTMRVALWSPFPASRTERSRAAWYGRLTVCFKHAQHTLRSSLSARYRRPYSTCPSLPIILSPLPLPDPAIACPLPT